MDRFALFFPDLFLLIMLWDAEEKAWVYIEMSGTYMCCMKLGKLKYEDLHRTGTAIEYNRLRFSM